MVMTKASMTGGSDDRGGKPNPGTSKDGRLSKNKGKGGKRDQPGWAGDLAAKSAPNPPQPKQG